MVRQVSFLPFDVEERRRRKKRQSILSRKEEKPVNILRVNFPLKYPGVIQDSFFVDILLIDIKRS